MVNGEMLGFASSAPTYELQEIFTGIHASLRQGADQQAAEAVLALVKDKTLGYPLPRAGEG